MCVCSDVVQAIVFRACIQSVWTLENNVLVGCEDTLVTLFSSFGALSFLFAIVSVKLLAPKAAKVDLM